LSSSVSDIRDGSVVFHRGPIRDASTAWDGSLKFLLAWASHFLAGVSQPAASAGMVLLFRRKIVAPGAKNFSEEVHPNPENLLVAPLRHFFA